jgi:hypothetical protein
VRIACLTHFRGRATLAPPLLRGGWQGFKVVMINRKINNADLQEVADDNFFTQMLIKFFGYPLFNLA